MANKQFSSEKWAIRRQSLLASVLERTGGLGTRAGVVIDQRHEKHPRSSEGLVASLESYTEEEVAKFLNIKVSSLVVRRATKQHHPPFRKVGKTTYYPKKEFHEWFEKLPLTRESRDADTSVFMRRTSRVTRRN